MKTLKVLTMKVVVFRRIFLLLSIIFFFLIYNVSATEPDSLNVYLCKTDSAYFVDLVFENISSDSLLIPAHFRNYYYGTGSSSGIMISTYNNKKLYSVDVGGLTDSDIFIFAKNRFIFIPPHSMIKYNFDLYRYLSKPNPQNEYGVDFSVNYIYRNIKKVNEPSKKVSMKTNYIILDNWKINKYK